MRNSILFVLAVASLESGCGAKLPSVKPFKMEVQQGNVVTSKMLLQLRPGMTRSQVRYIMGTPLIVDSFRDNRWDYFYELRKQGAVVEKRRVILDFDKDSLVSVRGDVIPSAENPDIKTIAEAPQKKVEAEKEQAWTDKLKFWKAEEGAADKTTEAATATAAVAVAATEAKPSKAQADTASSKVVTAEEEVVPYIPEGEYAAAPTPQDMAKGNTDAAANQVTEAKVHPVNEKEMAAQIADTVEPPPVFKQEAVAAPAVAAEPEAVLPPAVKAAPVASKSITAPVVAAATVAAAAVKPAETKKAAATAAKPVQQAVPAAKTAAVAAVEDDEVIPYIPEGEYVAPVVPTEQEMVKGNMAEANAPTTDAEAHQVTEKGVAPKADHAAEASPTFVAEQLPEPEPEPELPPPPVSKPIVKPVAQAAATAATLAAAEEKPAQAKSAAAKVVEPAPAVTQEAPAGDADINQAVAAWAQAWRTKDIKNYLAAYAPDFVPEGLPSKKAWEAQRKQRLSAAGNITLVLNNTQVQRDGSTATVQFEQKYAARAYKDELNKTLELRYAPAQKRWLITRERTEAAAGAVIAATESAKTSASVATDAGAVSNDAATVETSVDAAIQSWAQAWRSKNASAYFAAYSPAFVPEGLPSRAAWEAQRKKRLSPQQGKISLELADVNVSRDGDTAIATFTQKYASKSFSDEMVKRLELKLDATNNRWLIVRESAASGADVPVAKQQVTAPEGSSEHLDGVLEQIGF
ncbi:outer membrane protein assembly factor BamE [Methylophilus sp. OH31]|uniref:L,D-transpeptidase Cds6 family protein n=1 Tax=Methylophilus sp. OH31 TaxID=1387312 RepID=UPI001F5969B4|nr:outer membrane protein assembly factor BamE [Methylophilus sp. OH31]